MGLALDIAVGFLPWTFVVGLAVGVLLARAMVLSSAAMASPKARAMGTTIARAVATP